MTMEANHTSVNTVKWLSQALWYLQMSDMNTGALSVRVAVLQIHIAPSWQTVCCTWQLGSFEARMKTAAGGGRGTSCLDIFCFSQQKPVRKQLDAWEKKQLYIYNNYTKFAVGFYKLLKGWSIDYIYAYWFSPYLHQIDLSILQPLQAMDWSEVQHSCEKNN